MHELRPSIVSNDNLRLAIVMAQQTSRVRILRDADSDVEEVTVGDSLAEILDVDANITARCDLPQLETVTADDFSEDLILQTSSAMDWKRIYFTSSK